MSDSATVEQIRSAADIVQVIGEVVPLQRKGQNHFGCCPFHNEKTPSFSVSSQKQLFHCFGCKAGGDVFKFHQLYNRVDFRQSIEELGAKFGIEVKHQKRDSSWEESLEILEATCVFFEKSLYGDSSKEVREYLKSRKIPENLWKEFRLGAHPGGSTDVYKHLKKKDLSRDIAVRLGILGRTNSGTFIDRFRGRAMFSIADEKGQIRGFGGRSLGNDGPKYINSPASSVFNKKTLLYGMHLAIPHFRKKEYAVLVEGYLDVISLYEYGVRNVVCSMGTALTLEQVRKLKRWAGRVLSLYDGDKAGVLATERNLENFMQEGLESKVCIIPDAKDPDALLHDDRWSDSEKVQKLRSIFKSSKPAIDYLVEKKVLSLKDSVKRAQALRELFEFLDRVPNEIEREMLKKELVRRFELPENLLHKADSELSLPKLAYKADSKLQSAQSWDRELLKFLVLWGKNRPFDLTESLPYLSFSSKWSKLLRELAEKSFGSTEIAGLSWLHEAEESLQAEVREWVLTENLSATDEDLDENWLDLVGRLRKAFFKQESHRIQADLELAEGQQKIEEVRRLLTEKRDLVELMKSS